jgi:hypothetical protein
MNQQAVLYSIAASLMAAPVILAGTSDPAPVQLEQPAPSGDWEFELGLYGFIAGVDGTVSAGTQTATIDYGIDDILDHLDMTFMAAASAKKDRFRISADLVYLGLSGDGQPIGPVFESAEFELDTLLSTVAATYSVWEKPGCFLEIGAGARYLGMDTSLSFFDLDGLTPNVSESSDVDVWDALGVARKDFKVGFRTSSQVVVGHATLIYPRSGRSGRPAARSVRARGSPRSVGCAADRAAVLRSARARRPRRRPRTVRCG